MTITSQDVLDLINNLPYIMPYMVQGYIFISVYSFVMCKKVDTSHIFFKSVVISYTLKTLYDLALKYLSLPNDSSWYTPVLLLVSAFAGYILGICFQSQVATRFLLAIGIKRSINSTVWRDVIKPYTWVMFYCKNSDLAYIGQFLYGDEYSNEPVIALCNYKIVQQSTGEELVDYTDSSDYVVMLNAKGFDRIELEYARVTK